MEVIDGKKRSRSLFNFLSCFGFAASPEASESHKVRPKSETTPENSAVTTAAVAGIQSKEEVFEPAKRSFLCWFLKQREKKTKGEISNNRSHYHLRRAAVGSQIKPHVRNSQVHQVAFKYKTRVEPAQVYRLHPASPGLCSHFASAIVLRASECQETWLSRHGVSEPEPGPLMLIAMVLALLLVVSRITVITCVCAWLSLFPRLRAPTQRKNVPEKDVREDEEIDLNSKECKKMVVLKGLLARDRVRRLSPTKMAGAQGF